MTARAERSGARRDLDLLVVGDVNPDVIVDGEHVTALQFGQREVIVDSIVLAIGGSASIMAAAAARLGLRVGLVGVVGDDAFGRFMLDALRGRGVDVGACRVDPTRPTGGTVIVARPTDRAILTALGTIGDLDAADVTDGLLRRTRHLHIASFYLQPALRQGMPALGERARAAGVSLSIDPNWDPAETWDGGLQAVLPGVSVFLPNEAEATRIAGLPEAEVMAAARVIQGWSRETVVVKRGPAGAFGVGSDGREVAVPALAVEPVDAIGAGDAFDAGFFAGWLEGRPLADCLALGAACGALSTRAAGGTGSLASRAEAEAALAAGSWSVNRA